ncbi:MAG: restriction endonuclease subunit S [Desulfobacteraceae bacterium]|nr:restriction endonuclease subunit S [Desulfobacteraceae bacterium]
MAGKYQVYLEYKDSKSKWLDSIPKHWGRLPLKYLVAIRITDGPHETPEFVDEGVPFLSAEAVKKKSLDFTKKRGNITKELHEIYSKKCLPQFEDVFMVKSGNTTGALAIVETKQEFNIWSPLALIRANQLKILPRFLFYSMQADFFQKSVQLSWSQGTQPNIGMGVIENLHIATAPLNELERIIAFLDHETAKIDTLIEKQQKLIKLLKEKRQAVISHAVTKGLTPHVPMKDSGVEWLGEVPEHWEVKRLKNVSEIVDCRNKTPEYFEDGEYFVIRTTNVKQQKLNFNDARYTNEANFKIWTQRGIPPVGSILFTREAPAGEICLVSDNLKFCMGQRMMNFICHEHEYSKYLFDFLLSDCLDRYIESVSHGSTVSHLRVGQVENIPVIVPPKNEVIQIHEYLKLIKEKYIKLTNIAESAIKLMQERRTALISAAVTGKIDVRNWKAPKQKQTTREDTP